MKRYIIILILIFASCGGKKKSTDGNHSGEPSPPVEKVVYKDSADFIKNYKSEIASLTKYLSELINSVHLLDDVKIADFNRRCSLLLIQAERLQKNVDNAEIQSGNFTEIIELYKKTAHNIYEQVEVVRKIAQNREWSPDIKILDKFIELRNEYNMLEKALSETATDSVGKKLVKVTKSVSK